MNDLWNYINGGWVNAGSNLLGYVTVVSILGLLWHEWQKTCAMTTCLRVGKVEVKGTTKHLCPKHSTRENHDRFKKLHQERYPERVGHE
jgi:hypothetical protein